MDTTRDRRDGLSEDELRARVQKLEAEVKSLRARVAQLQRPDEAPKAPHF